MSDYIKTWTELIKFPTIEERIDYLRTYSTVGQPTFGYGRWLNQRFYRSIEYKRLRQEIVRRQHGMDLGVDGYPLPNVFTLHHMNPITFEDIVNGSPLVWDPEYLVCVSLATHNAIHYQKENTGLPRMASRSKHDTCPWRRT